MRAAGAVNPIVAEKAGAAALWDRLRAEDTWHGRRVLIATVPGGRQELINGLRAAGAHVDAVDCYAMQARPVADIKRDWHAARPDAALLASPSTVQRLAEAIGVDALRGLRAIVPIGLTTAAALANIGIESLPPETATFEAVVEALVARTKVDPSEVG